MNSLTKSNENILRVTKGGKSCLFCLPLNVYYPKVEYSEFKILKDTKNILHQTFVKKYCKLMQVYFSFLLPTYTVY